MEKSLPELLAEDPEAGFERLVRTRQHRVYAFSLGLTGSEAEAEDVAQEAFVRAHRALSGYPSDRIRELKLDAWLHTIALNVVRNQRRGARPVLLELDEERDRDASPGPERALEERESLRGVARELARLPEAQREAVVLRCVQGFRYSEVAALLSRPVGTVKSDVHRALETLRGRLESEVNV